MKILKSLTLGLAVIGMVTMNSCSKDPCADVTCNNGGICVDGTCDCADWYEGSSCNTEMRTKFYGTYQGTLTVAGSSNAIQTELSMYNGNVQRVWIDNDFYFNITGSTTGEIPLQVINSGGTTFNITGNVNLNGNTVQMNMTWSSNGTGLAVVIIATK